MKKRFFIIMSLLLLSVGVFFAPQNASAYGECSQYGIMATYDYLSDSCKCMSGYVFDDSLYGDPQCVSCSSKYGFGATADYLGGGCKCRSGYVWGKNFLGKPSCVSADQECRDKYGIMSSYNNLDDTCECSYGYVMDGGRCTDGDIVCHSKHGYNSDYNSLSNRCECDSGYTLDDSNQCVKKQNNVYFTLKELDTDNKKAIVKSDYDYRYYLISYNSGCYAYSFRRYLNNKIVINLGTDFDLDTWDKIILQDDNETCDITRRERADSSTTLVEPEPEEVTNYFIRKPVINTPTPVVNAPAPVVNNPAITKPSPAVIKSDAESFKIDESKIKVLDKDSNAKLKEQGNLRKCPSTLCDVIKHYTGSPAIQLIESYNNEEWFKVSVKDNSGEILEGWMHTSILEVIPEENKTPEIQPNITKVNEEKKNSSWIGRLWQFLFGGRKK